MKGKKDYVKCDDVWVTKVQYKGLIVLSILRFARTQTNIDKYLPEYDYPKESNRKWLCIVINIVVQIEFQDFIKKVTEDRRKSLIDSQNLG